MDPGRSSKGELGPLRLQGVARDWVCVPAGPQPLSCFAPAAALQQIAEGLQVQGLRRASASLRPCWLSSAARCLPARVPQAVDGVSSQRRRLTGCKSTDPIKCCTGSPVGCIAGDEGMGEGGQVGSGRAKGHPRHHASSASGSQLGRASCSRGRATQTRCAILFGAQGFWLNNGACQWPVDSLKLGNNVYTQDQLVQIMDLSTGPLGNVGGAAGRAEASGLARWWLPEPVPASSEVG